MLEICGELQRTKEGFKEQQIGDAVNVESAHHSSG